MQKIETVIALGELVQAYRKQQGLTQIQLAAASGVGVRFLRELEGGKATCQIGKTLTVLNMLGINIIALNRSEQMS